MLARRLAFPVPGQAAHRVGTQRTAGAWERAQPGGAAAGSPGLVPVLLLQYGRRKAAAAPGTAPAAAGRDPWPGTPGGGTGGGKGRHPVLGPLRLRRQRVV